MVIAAHTPAGVRQRWNAARADAGLPVEPAALKLEPGVSGPVLVLWRGKTFTLAVKTSDGFAPATEPKRK